MTSYPASIRKQFAYYRMLGERTFAQLEPEHYQYRPDEAANSIAIIVGHLSGNMLSRWTDFYTSDGEKTWRKREAEFEAHLATPTAVQDAWNEGWAVVEAVLDSLTEADLDRIVYIRNQGHTVLEAVNRQLAHYAYHIGQIVYLGRMLVGPAWQSLSIPRGGSAAFNAKKFAEDKKRGHYTDDFPTKRE